MMHRGKHTGDWLHFFAVHWYHKGYLSQQLITKFKIVYIK